MKRFVRQLPWLLTLLVLAFSVSVGLAQDGAGDVNPGPTAISPINNAVLRTNTVSFEFEKLGDNLYYDFYLGKVGGGQIIRDYWARPDANVLAQRFLEYPEGQSEGSNTSWQITIPNIPGNGPYEWYVRSWEGGTVWTLFTGPVNFTIDATPLNLDDDSSDPAVRGDITYTWDYDERATWYQLLVGIPANVSQSGTFETLRNDWYQVNGSDNMLTCAEGNCAVNPINAFTNGTYAWYVRSYGPLTGNSPWATGPTMVLEFAQPDASTFNTGTFNVFASNTINTTDQPVFEFNDIANASWYNLVVYNSVGTLIHNGWYRRSRSNCSLVEETVLCQAFPTGYPETDKFLLNGTYTWFVRAWGPGGLSNNGQFEYYSGSNSLTVNMASVANLYPGGHTLNNFVVSTTTNASIPITAQSQLNFGWNSMNGATWWRLIIRKVENNGTRTTVFDAWRHTGLQCAPLVSSTCSWATPLTLANGNYEWWLQAFGPAGSVSKFTDILANDGIGFTPAKFNVNIPS